MYDYHLLHPDTALALESLRADLTDAYERLRKDLTQKLNVPQAQIRALSDETHAALNSLSLSLNKRIDQILVDRAALVARVKAVEDQIAALDDLKDAQ
jgi:hypothetical protein